MEGDQEDKVAVFDEEEQTSTNKHVTYVMTELHEFLKHVFQRLPAKSLLICSRVCKRWKRVAKLVLKSREVLTWAQYNYHIDTAIETSPIGSESGEGAVPNSLGIFGRDLERCLHETWSVPDFCLFISEFKAANEFHGSPLGTNAENYSKVGVQYYISTFLPSSCELAAVCVPGTISTTRDLSAVAESEGEGGALAILFPKIEEVEIRRASIRNPHKGNIWEQTGIERHQNVKCILVFESKARTWLAGKKLQETFFKDNQQPVIAGAIVNRSLSVVKNSTECIIFSGERVNAASVLIGSHIDNEESLIGELRRLKNAELSETNSIGLMFACIGRGSHFYSEWDMESRAFRKLFPNTPLFGVFGNGEIGCTNLPKSKWKNVPEMSHGYTTIMCLISFG